MLSMLTSRLSPLFLLLSLPLHLMCQLCVTLHHVTRSVLCLTACTCNIQDPRRTLRSCCDLKSKRGWILARGKSRTYKCGKRRHRHKAKDVIGPSAYYHTSAPCMHSNVTSPVSAETEKRREEGTDRSPRRGEEKPVGGEDVKDFISRARTHTHTRTHIWPCRVVTLTDISCWFEFGE